jgi:predicted nucleic acid-binding protein
MARYFLDSSALVKRYHHEYGSGDLDALFSIAGDWFLISRLALVEVQSCLARLMREGKLSSEDRTKSIARMDADVVSGQLTVVAVSTPRLSDACSVLGTHGLAMPIRTLDAIHLATAQAVNGRSRIAAFVAADKKLLAAAQACGLATLEVA